MFFEAKLNSGFAPSQVERELLVACEQANHREFFLVLVTRGMAAGMFRCNEKWISLEEYMENAKVAYAERPDIALKISKNRSRILTISWESIMKAMLDASEQVSDTDTGENESDRRSRQMAWDLMRVMRARNLFVFRGFSTLGNLNFPPSHSDQPIFFRSESLMSPSTNVEINISKNINSGMSLVYKLYGEMNALLKVLQRALMNSENDLRPQNSKGFRLYSITEKSFPEQLMATDMGLVLAIGAETPDLAATKSTKKAGQKQKSRKPSKITSQSRYLMIRAVLFDPDENIMTFEPGIIAAVVGDLTWRSKTVSKNLECDEFDVRPKAISSLAKRITVTAEIGDTITPRPESQDPRLKGKIQRIEFRPLSELTSEQQVNEFIATLLHMSAEGVRASDRRTPIG
ncbi:hypothetical protein [Novipirellula maiorica]|uniref:hypothetical protein n=1 Tax=Novipirellula maiorica TaxID=1265734 RepID=UPI0011818B74|nr:hypothetical protein [Rhodopirellula maiorica]